MSAAARAHVQRFCSASEAQDRDLVARPSEDTDRLDGGEPGGIVREYAAVNEGVG